MNIADALFIFGVACLAIALFESNRRFHNKRVDEWREWVQKTWKYDYNYVTKRFELTKEQLEALPFKTVTIEEFWEIAGTLEYNPSGLYAHLVELKKAEAGHDLQFRYIITK